MKIPFLAIAYLLTACGGAPAPVIDAELAPPVVTAPDASGAALADALPMEQVDASPGDASPLPTADASPSPSDSGVPAPCTWSGNTPDDGSGAQTGTLPDGSTWSCPADEPFALVGACDLSATPWIPMSLSPSNPSVTCSSCYPPATEYTCGGTRPVLLRCLPGVPDAGLLSCEPTTSPGPYAAACCPSPSPFGAATP